MCLETLIAECTAYDFKLKLEEKSPKSWLQYLSAFANCLGIANLWSREKVNSQRSPKGKEMTTCRTFLNDEEEE
ncbi:MAG: hypothetical protein J6Y78_03595 [Paludibacteraceae bacterium]|nr:hypothetical protein [Paludibacteraceae bacterium]